MSETDLDQYLAFAEKLARLARETLVYEIGLPPEKCSFLKYGLRAE